MKTIIIKSSNDADANAIMKFARSRKMKAKFLAGKDLEDIYFARMIDEGMKEKGEVPLAEIRRMLRK